ncbi:RidA family protein [Pseudomaricurvus alkylphenolicus]|uniref:RidA family protein n=1 Tax=Pseudomaricurvus alkylphenolicus TaxID=1306991 RepID=UPI00141DC69A|nr:RidA family protein [Pseudomaricurvus alkylphenolicus]NIB38048.1 RidA family protein [Pseudomaricurvus alkylphenolicus]
MKTAVTTGLPELGLPLEWATISNGHLYTTVVAVTPEGTLETGDPLAQMDLTFANLKKVCEAAGGSLADLNMVQVFLTDIKYSAQLNDVWGKYFEAPYPNRATIVVSGMVAPGLVVEVCAQGHIEQN